MNVADSSLDTKKRILEVARRLFAENGFDGTSVREIAKQSDVNLAAINYHFKSKENLFWAIMREGYERAEEFCSQYMKESSSVEELSLKVFARFQEEGELVRNYMKMSLSTRLVPEGEEAEALFSRPPGPPGGQFFAEFIQKEVDYPLSPMGSLWGQKAIFGTMIHWATMCHTAQIKAQTDPLLSPEQIREDVRHIIRSSMAYLKAHPEIFGKK